MAELAIRMVVSLAIVVGLLLLCARMGQKRFKGRSGSPLQVLHRQSLSRSTGVAVVSVGGRTLLLGTTDQQVQMLTELDPAELEAPTGVAEAAPVTAPVAVAEPEDSLLGRMAGLVDEPSRWVPTGAKRRTAVAAVAPLATAAARPRIAVAPAPQAPASFASVLEDEIAVDRKVAQAAPKLTPAQVLLAEEPATGALAGSLLSPDTWRLAARAVTRRAS